MNDRAAMIALIASATGRDAATVAARLKAERRRPGSTVADDFARRNLERYTWSAGLEAFYSATDSFIYELAVWNANPMKRSMRGWIARYLSRRQRRAETTDRLRVLTVGDGLGFDALSFARAGSKVTYFEFPGPSERFARALFARAESDVRVVTDLRELDAIGAGAFDAVICLDVLEHVPDVPGFVRSLAERLAPGGVLVVSAPFALIHPAYPTHLKANRRHSGRLWFYRQAGLRLAAARIGWDPIVLEKPDPARPGSLGDVLKRAMAWMTIAPFGLILQLGRFTSLPFLPLHLVRRLTTQR